jgi:hypothetical protein
MPARIAFRVSFMGTPWYDPVHVLVPPRLRFSLSAWRGESSDVD